MKEYKSYIFTGDKMSCTGCGACTKVCTHHALTMSPDNEGFLYPSLDKDKCIKCGACDISCPVVGRNEANSGMEQHCYIATTRHEEYYKESASIGICTMLSDYVISQGGIVFGCFLDESNWTAFHVGVKDEDGVRSIRNSKYLQSDLKDTFFEVKDYLMQNIMILFIGTPCQIAGLKSFLHKDYQNLYTVDIICHGVFSPSLMTLESKYWKSKYGADISNFRFRSKLVYKRTNGGMVNFDIRNKNGSLKHVERHASASPSYRCFAYSGDGINYSLRLSCYTCHFRSETRYADITVGDPWCISDAINSQGKPFGNKNPIRSIYSSNTKKGLELLSHINSLLIFKEFKRDDLFRQDAVIKKNRVIPPQREELYKRIKSEDYANVVQDVLHCDLQHAHEEFVKKYRLLVVNDIKDIVRPIIYPIYNYVRKIKKNN